MSINTLYKLSIYNSDSPTIAFVDCCLRCRHEHTSTNVWQYVDQWINVDQNVYILSIYKNNSSTIPFVDYCIKCRHKQASTIQLSIIESMSINTLYKLSIYNSHSPTIAFVDCCLRCRHEHIHRQTFDNMSIKESMSIITFTYCRYTNITDRQLHLSTISSNVDTSRHWQSNCRSLNSCRSIHYTNCRYTTVIVRQLHLSIVA